MSIHLMCLTSDGGIPIFTKKLGDVTGLPFSTVASLNGVHMFCKNQGTRFNSTMFDDGLVVWQEYENSLTLIIVARGGFTELVARDILDMTFNAMVISVGIDNLKAIQSIERLKRDLKLSYQLIDQILENSEMVKFNDSIMCPESLAISERMLEYTEQVRTVCVCLLIRQKVACGTAAWWELNVIDRQLLTMIFGISSSLPKDVPVFLPIHSPTLVFRFIAIPLTQNLTICMVLGAEPSYAELETITQQFWRGEIETLVAAEKCYPRNFPENVELDSGILGILLINTKRRKFMISRNIQPSAPGKRAIAGAHRLDILRTFFHQAIHPFLTDVVNQSTFHDSSETNIVNLEQYWCSDYHKCHARIEGDNILCVLYVSAIPTQTMRLITRKTLEMLLAEKDVCWS